MTNEAREAIAKAFRAALEARVARQAAAEKGTVEATEASAAAEDEFWVAAEAAAKLAGLQ